jgi:two-component system, OmpR family, sensor kinase
MTRPHSIRTYLAIGSFFFFLIVFLLGIFSIASLRYVNALDVGIRTVWLPSTTFVGDLNNFTSDFPAAERAALLASNPAEVAARAAEMGNLDQAIARAQESYERIRHSAPEAALYAQLSAKWRTYRRIVEQELALLRANRKAEAIALYRANSQAAYNGASDTLGLLTNRTIAGARAASTRAENAFDESQMLILIAMAFAGLLMAAAVTLIKRRISNPLLNLSASIRRLAANEMDIEISSTTRLDEIGEIARAVVVFRDNAIDLATSRRGLAQQARMLEEKLAEEQRLALLQRNFVSMASHEFRTPLTSIDAHAQRLLKIRDRATDDEFSERIVKIRRAVLRLTNLIANLIETSRMDEDNAELYFHPAEMDLRAVLNEACQFHQEIAPRQIVAQYGSQPLTLVADAKLLFQVFSNLLSNAIKYSPSEKPVEISASADPGGITVAVQDHGIGIPGNDIPHLFQRFYRGTNAASTVGTGIGLFFVKTVVELHGGETSVASTEGLGTCFSIHLPRCPPGRQKFSSTPERRQASAFNALA